MPSLSIWIQFIRNFFCVCKSLLPVAALGGFLHERIDVSTFIPTTSHPYRIELIIAITQLAAVVFSIQDGVKLISAAFLASAKLKRMRRVIDRRQLSEPSIATVIVQRGVLDSLRTVYFRAFEGFLQLVFGIAFTFLAMNSLHIHGPTHPKPLIDALLAMEIGLVYFLFKMWGAFWAKYRTADTYISVIGCIHAIDKGTSVGDFLNRVQNIEPADQTLVYDALMTLNPFHEPLVLSAIRPSKTIEEIVDMEIAQVQDILTATMRRESDETVERLQAKSASSLQDAPLEFLFFALNIVAGYGYLLGILAFYCPELGYGNHMWFRTLKFGLSNDDADWWGNLAGDAAWTIEPLVMILMAYSSPSQLAAADNLKNGGSAVGATKVGDCVPPRGGSAESRDLPSSPPNTRRRRISIKT